MGKGGGVMSFEDYIRYVWHISIQEFNEMSLSAKMQIEYEYCREYGF